MMAYKPQILLWNWEEFCWDFQQVHMHTLVYTEMCKPPLSAWTTHQCPRLLGLGLQMDGRKQ